MAKNTNAMISKFKFCCYEIDRDDDQDYKKKAKKLNTLMLNRNQNSDIKFQTAFRNKNIPIYKVLQDLYEEYTDVQQILPFLQRKRVNPQLLPNNLSDRDDLQYYIPQLITFMVIECNLQNVNLNQLVLKASMTDFYFAHCVYFYLQSLSKNKQNKQIQLVNNFIQHQFLPKMQMYNNNRLSGHQLTKSLLYMSKIPQYQSYQNICTNQVNQDIQIDNSSYGLIKYPQPPPDNPPTIIRVKVKTYFQGGFEQTPKFWIDLVNIGQQIALTNPDQRKQKLQQLIKLQINYNLPSVVYIPFYSNKIRLYTILCVWSGRVFSTKQRAPFSIWVELYREQQQHGEEKLLDFYSYSLLQQQNEQENVFKDQKKNFMKKIYQKLSRPFTVADGENTLKIKKYIKQKTALIQKKVRKKMKFRSFYEKDYSDDQQKQKDCSFAMSMVYQTKSDGRSRKSMSDQMMLNDKQQSEQQQLNYFPVQSQQVIQQYKKKSIYRNLKSWRMIHLMVKLGDDLKQQQFAMQLINRFQYIFQKQKIQCLLKPYEVVSLGPNFGLVEMVNDATTLDGLFKKLNLRKMTLKDFFDKNYKKNKAQAKKNFMRSLAGYSLVTYFLQVKDRHNGNILLHRNGSLVHIDYGFFLTNAPGKGVQLQKKVPFKLLSQYVQVLGSLNSQMFFDFRRLFYKGFKAIINNQEMILSIVKMMYKSQGEMMECFKKGEKAIIELEGRLNPEGSIEDFCYDLINNSLDNWRAKWYDKFQYFFQKIYY